MHNAESNQGNDRISILKLERPLGDMNNHIFVSGGLETQFDGCLIEPMNCEPDAKI